MEKTKGASKTSKRKKIRFEYFAPHARLVKLSGTFDGWSTQGPGMKKMGDGHWERHLLLKPGEYEYRYLVDGAWANDQRTMKQVPNAFGEWNNVVTITG